MVLDEAQAIKNPDSQVARAAYRAPGPASACALTGTPVENRLEELWSLMHFANPGLLGGRERLRGALREPDRRAATPRPRPRCARGSGPFVLRRLKRDVAPELPPRTEAVLHVRARRGRARRLRRRARRDAQGAWSRRLAEGAACSRRSRRCSGCARRRATRRSSRGSSADRSSKVERLVEALEDAVGRRAQGAGLLAVDVAARPRRAAPRARRRSPSRGSTARRAIAPRWSTSSRTRTGRR